MKCNFPTHHYTTSPTHDPFLSTTKYNFFERIMKTNNMHINCFGKTGCKITNVENVNEQNT